ncbi:Glycine betaine/carnitine/choline transport system permease protein OpuCB [anaerobic digester metagenome]
MIGDLLALWIDQEMGLRTLEHLAIFGVSLMLVIPAGAAIGVLLYRRPHMAEVAFSWLNVVETMPELALLVLLIPLVGIGTPAVIAACVLYSLLPVSRSAYTGLSHVRREFIEVGEALGLRESEMLRYVRLPLSLPLLAGGIRIAVIFCMGIVTLGGLVGAGGLGAPLQAGISFRNTPLILLCSGWIAILALLADGVVGALERGARRRYGGEDG